ncbi:hypothetical protein GGX14DRAFT_477326 [Mycena pura]|uniref:DUF7918 domain-containing protein n=1 Tax=Mycena pura TaxID=153505 RepID=A0AAD6XZH4_9AGAR|nr:hypothetical protein GGX14DRAFT_477326 [Mycena pura]
MTVNISSFTAWITIEESNCPKFSVNWSNSFRDRPVFAQLFIDGVVCSTHFMLDCVNHPSDPSSIGISYATTSDYTRRDFVFSTIVVTDDDAYLHTLDNPSAFGSIRLELWEADITAIRRAPFQHTYGAQVLEPQIIHETSKKAGAHHVRFGDEYVVPQSEVNIVSGTRCGAAPLATFTFCYRPAGMLMAAGILPRPAPPAVRLPRIKAESVDDQIQHLEAQLEALEAYRAAATTSSSSGRASTLSQQKLKHQWHTDPRTGRSVQVIDLTDL